MQCTIDIMTEVITSVKIEKLFFIIWSKVHKSFCFCPLITLFCSLPLFVTWPILAQCWCECKNVGCRIWPKLLWEMRAVILTTNEFAVYKSFGFYPHLSFCSLTELLEIFQPINESILDCWTIFWSGWEGRNIIVWGWNGKKQDGLRYKCFCSIHSIHICVPRQRL